ncbi:MAG: 2OG-Fe(II) oxygenase family protein [Pseudomonadota bacterium]
MTTSSENWMESSDVLSLFPTYVWKIQLNPSFHQRINPRIRALLAHMRDGQPELERGNGWQSTNELHQREELSELIACFNRAALKVIRFLKIGYEDFTITGCWANVNPAGASHGIHGHPNNFLSGVYYVQTQPGADSINFYDPRIQTGIIRPPVTELTTGNTDQVVVQVSVGALLLFPAYLQHSVDPNRSQTLRISISFNVMFRDFVENLSRPLW